ncbi:vWA domain-containing protein [Henriciella litoralis]|uniref:vWA domain-containing protein n=1 Tax=Henriciella litoralis TaxID=568102 RepID=UPI0009FE08EE|nr:VWA domain-containing protein [Henriciella litoralis]
MTSKTLMLAAASAIALASNATAQDATSEDPGAVMVVLDASGSMWGQVDGLTKIEIARSTLSSTLEDFSPDTELGLIAYGHRRKGDCSDIETLVEPAIGTVGEVVSSASSLNPKGMTPLTDAVRKAAEVMRIKERKATIVLLTDGLETCNADPCALGRELEASGVDFTTHVIGFGLTKDEGRQVSCLAAETGGRYFDASNAEDLGKALDQTVLQPEDIALDSPVERDAPPVTLEAPDEVAMGTSFEVTWSNTDAPGPKDYIDVMETGTNRTTAEASYTYVSEGSPLTIRAPARPGSYNVRYVSEGESVSDRLVAASRPLTVTELATFVSAPATAKAGEGIIVVWAGPAGEGDYVDVIEAGATRTNSEINYFYTTDASPSTLWMPVTPGEYQIRYVMEGPEGRVVQYKTTIDVTDAEAVLQASSSVAAGETFTVEWEGPGSPGDYVDVVPAGYEETYGELAYAYTADGDVLEITAPSEPGNYELRYILEGGNEGRVVVTSQPLTIR